MKLQIYNHNLYLYLYIIWLYVSGFAFVEFEDERDAEDAIRGLDGTNICGSRVRVEPSTGRLIKTEYFSC